MSERRTAPRQSLKQPLPGALSSPVGEWVGMAVAHDISAGGLGLYANLLLLPGEQVSIELMHAPPSLCRRLWLRVAYFNPDPEGGYLLGAQFLQPLAPSDLDGLAG